MPFKRQLEAGMRVAEDPKTGTPVIIKKYANRRLYNTETSSYVTLDHLCELVKQGTEFEVHDARTGEDITRSVLTQIIFEEEAKGQNLLPIRFLRQLIRFYGDPMQSFVPGYLDLSMQSFIKNQEDMRERIAKVFGNGNEAVETLARQNMAMFEHTMQMFTPVGEPPAETETTPPPPPTPAASDLDDIKAQMDEMRRQLAELREQK